MIGVILSSLIAWSDSIHSTGKLEKNSFLLMSCVFLVLSCNLGLYSSPSNETRDLLGNATFICPLYCAVCRPPKALIQEDQIELSKSLPKWKLSNWQGIMTCVVTRLFCFDNDDNDQLPSWNFHPATAGSRCRDSQHNTGLSSQIPVKEEQ